MFARTVRQPWHVRFEDGSELEATPGDELRVLAIDGPNFEALVEFSSGKQGWFSYESVLMYSERLLSTA